MKTLLRFIAAGALMVIGGVAALAYPPKGGRVNDFAGVLSAGVGQKLAAELERVSGHQLAVVTIKSLEGQSVEAYARGIGNAWGVGRRELNDGVVFLVAPSERKVCIPTGPGATPQLTDREAREIIQSKVLPQFRAGNIDSGIVAGVQAAVRELSPAPTVDGCMQSTCCSAILAAPSNTPHQTHRPRAPARAISGATEDRSRDVSDYGGTYGSIDFGGGGFDSGGGAGGEW